MTRWNRISFSNKVTDQGKLLTAQKFELSDHCIFGERLVDWFPQNPDVSPFGNLWSILRMKIYENGRRFASRFSGHHLKLFNTFACGLHVKNIQQNFVHSFQTFGFVIVVIKWCIFCWNIWYNYHTNAMFRDVSYTFA